MAARKQLRGHAAVKPTVDEFLASLERMNRASADFLKIDLETALTFAKIARETGDDARMKRSRKAARRAYDTVSKLLQKVNLTHNDARVITRALTELRSELRGLGETV